MGLYEAITNIDTQSFDVRTKKHSRPFNPLFLFFSDLHIHCHKKSQDRLFHCLDTLKWVFEVARKRGIKKLIFGGDLYHDRQKIDVFTYHHTYKTLLECLAPGDVELYLLLGNHDIWHYDRCDINSVAPLASLPHVTVIDKPSLLDIGGHSVGFLPYTHEPAADIASIPSFPAGHRKVLVGHVAIKGAMLNTLHGTVAGEDDVEHDGDMTLVGQEVFDGWDNVFLGHYHAEQKLSDTVEYIGSPLQLSFGEAMQQKHVILFDPVTGTKEYVNNDFSPKHIVSDLGDLDKYELSKNFVIIRADNLESTELTEARHNLLKEVKAASVQVRPKPKQRDEKEDEASVQLVQEMVGRGSDLVQIYLDHLKVTESLEGLDAELATRVGNLLAQEASNELGDEHSVGAEDEGVGKGIEALLGLFS